MPELCLEIPCIPPSVGHYNRQAVVNGRVAFFPTKEAKEWKRSVAVIASGRKLRGQAYTVSYLVYVPDRRRRDIDNFGKCILDSLTAAGVIDDDSGVTELHAYKRMDRQSPRTVIVVRTEQEQPRELARAQGFPDSYKFTGNREAVVNRKTTKRHIWRRGIGTPYARASKT